MPTIPMVALKQCVYAGRRMAAGTEFNARGLSDARTLQAVGMAGLAPTRPVAAVLTPAPVVEAKAPISAPAVEPDAPADLNPEPPPQETKPEAPDTPAADQPADSDVDDISPRTGKPTRAYRRRDMTAEGSKG